MSSVPGANAPLTILRTSAGDTGPLVYVTTFPRSGTTWMLSSLSFLLAAQQGEMESPVEGGEKLTLLSGVDLWFKDRFEPGRTAVIKSHYTLVQFAVHCPHSKMIYVLRDGRDALTSSFSLATRRITPGINVSTADNSPRLHGVLRS